MRKIFLSACLLLTTFFGFSQQYTLLVGTFTNGKSTGIYEYDFNPSTSDAILLDSIRTSNPSFLAVSPDNKYVYAVNEDDATKGGGKVSAYSFDKGKRKLSFINQETSGGDSPCYVTIDKTGKWAIVGNYGSGTLSVLPIAPDGGLGTASITIKHNGSGPNKERQQGSHVHSTVLSPNNKYLYVQDLGIDKVMMYNFNSKTGLLTTRGNVVLKPGSGPRHMEFHPNGKWVYVVQEMGGLVTAFNYNDGVIRQIQEISLLPDGYKGTPSSADIHISPDGQFLYATNRNPSNTITIFKINQFTGKLEVIGHQSTLGKVPRNFNFDPTGNLLLIANQDSNNISIFQVDKQTGMLTDTGKQIIVPNPVCIKWITGAAPKKK
jgi:6-phosphogluconolactonase